MDSILLARHNLSLIKQQLFRISSMKKFYVTIASLFFSMGFNHIFANHCNDFNETLTSLNNKYNQKISSIEKSRWYNLDDFKIKSIFIVVHGLNLKPSKMNDLITVLGKQHHGVLRLALMSDQDPTFTVNSWQQQAIDYYCLTINKAKKQKLAVSFLGYSIGASIGSLLVSQQYLFDKLILFAPALSLHWYSKIPERLPLPKGVMLPSFNNKQYRHFNGLKILTYQAQAKLRKNFSVKQLAIWPKTLIFMREKDEIVSYQELSFFRDPSHQQITFITLDSLKRFSVRGKNHLMIDKESLGDEQWSIVLKNIKGFLDKESGLNN